MSNFRGPIAKREITPDVIVNDVPVIPHFTETQQESFTKLFNMVQRIQVVTEPMIEQLVNLVILKDLKQQALDIIKSEGLVSIDPKNRMSQNPAVGVYFSALREQRSILRDLGLIAPVGTKKKAVNIFTQFLEEDE